MKHALVRPAFLSLALLGALALGSQAQDGGAEDKSPAKGAAPTTEDAAAKETPAKDAPAKDAPAKDPADEAPDFSGKYLADGVSNVGKPYKALVEITRDKDVYQVVWVLGPREGYSGVGVVERDALCVGWAIGEVPGVVIYKRTHKDDGTSLTGRWTAPGSQGKTYKETLKRLP